MYKKDDILLKLNAENYYIDLRSLNSFIKMWNIDAVYEDEENENYYDDFAITKIKKGISLKAQGFSDEQIIAKIQKIEAKELPVTYTNSEILDSKQREQEESKAELRNLTLDVTTQTLQMLAESVAKKITDDIKNSDMAQQLIEAGGYKKDNEILSGQIQELIDHNKKLAQRIEQLEKKREGFWSKLKKVFSE